MHTNDNCYVAHAIQHVSNEIEMKAIIRYIIHRFLVYNNSYVVY